MERPTMIDPSWAVSRNTVQESAEAADNTNKQVMHTKIIVFFMGDSFHPTPISPGAAAIR